MPEYTPTTESVRAVWCAFSEYGGLADRPHSGLWDDRLAEFGRWLAAHDREVAARTLEAASDDYYGDTHIPGLSALTWLRERAVALRSGTEGSGQ